jgi:hypothetical protein
VFLLLEDFAIEIVVEQEANFNNAMGQESLTRFDQPKKKEKNKNRNKNKAQNSNTNQGEKTALNPIQNQIKVKIQTSKKEMTKEIKNHKIKDL